MTPGRLRLLLVSSELAPFASTGGLGEAVQGLALALAALGHDVRAAVPRYRGTEAAAGPLEVVLPCVPVPVGSRVVEGALLEGRLGTVPVYFVAQDHYYDRPALYATPERDYWDNCERFAFFARAVLTALPALEWAPHVIHAHDWQTGLLPAYLRTLYRDTPFYRGVATVFTVHNLAYQGLFWHRDFPLTGLPDDLFTPEGVEFYGMLSFLKGGLMFADRLTTVSPTYAREIQSPDFGERLDGVLRHRRAHLRGILHGIDPEAWNPRTDPALPHPFGPGDLEARDACKQALRAELGLAGLGADAALVALVSPLVDPRGVDVAAAAVPRAVADGLQFVVMGRGDARHEQAFQELAAAHPGAVAVHLGWDPARMRRILAGADLFLLPSRVEPFAVEPLYALRYGAVPVLRRTGGLADTVQDWDGRDGTGFLFDAGTPAGCLAALRRALEVRADRPAWRALVRRAMSQDVSWERAAGEYLACYREALEAAAGGPAGTARP